MAANLLEKRVASKLLFIRHTTRLIRREFCAVAVQEEKEGHQTGIPLIIAPHVIRRAFIVHPSTKEVNASLKYQWFTKTKLYEGLPSSLSDVDSYFSVEEYEVVKEPFRNSVLQNYGFRKEATNDRKNERSQELLKLGVLQDLLRFGWSFADRYPHLNDCFLVFEPKIKIHWVRHHNFYQLEHKRPKPAYIIRVKEPAPLFEPGVKVHCTSLNIKIIAFIPIPLNASVISSCAQPPAPELTLGPSQFFAFLQIPGVGTLELSNPPEWGRKKRANALSFVNTATFFIDRTVE